jgi:phosphotransferase system enzyme I (PtsI)
MFPMISGLEELREAKRLLEEAKDDLRRAGQPFDEKIPVGTMIEIPSAVTIADLLARECDFFSIGTNDLIQYSLAIDRVNQNVSYLYKPLHPAVLRNIRHVIRTAREFNIPAAMCGEMAGEPMYSVILIGLGLAELSMNAAAIPRVKKIILSLAMKDAVELAQRALELPTAEEVERYISEEMVRRFPADVTADGRQICLL